MISTTQNALLRIATFAALAMSVAAPVSAQSVLYRETFGRPEPATGNQGTVLWDWMRFNAAGGTGSITNGISSDGTGKPIDLANTTTAGPNGDETTGAYAEGWQYMDGTLRLAMTTEFAFDPVAASPVTFSWWQGANYDGGVTPGLNEGRLAIRIGGAWYASAQVITNTPVTSGANFGSTDNTVAQGAEFKSIAYNPAAANWLTLTFDGDYDATTNTPTASTVPLALGAAPAAPLTGQITAFGLYRDGTGQNFRFDNFTIEGSGTVPGQNANFDGINGVDGHDFLIWQRNFGKATGATLAQGDANGDQAVTTADLGIWKSKFGTAAAGAAGAVPEPGSLALVSLAALGLAARGRRSLSALASRRS